MPLPSRTVTQGRCIRWKWGQQLWARREVLDPTQYDVTRIDVREARPFVEDHHYSGSYVADRHRFGLWHGPRLVGVAVLSVPAGPRVLRATFPGLVPHRESLELGRFVLLDQVPATGETWFLARVFRAAAGLGVRGVLSFSDPVPRTAEDGRALFPGHVGCIYQASNARYTGRTEASWKLLLPDGSEYSERNLDKIRKQVQGHTYAEERLVRCGARPLVSGQDPVSWLSQALREARVRRVWHPGCHRYVFVLGKRPVRVARPTCQRPTAPDPPPAWRYL
jgi:hypothetical protein